MYYLKRTLEPHLTAGWENRMGYLLLERYSKEGSMMFCNRDWKPPSTSLGQPKLLK
jgi:hypothetical protein